MSLDAMAAALDVAGRLGQRTKPIPRRNPVRRTTGLTTVDPRTYGAVCDGVTNDWTALKAAFTAAEMKANQLVIIPGDMRVVIPDPGYMRVTSGMTVRGVTVNGKPGRLLLEGGGNSSQMLHLEDWDGAPTTYAHVEDLIIERKASNGGLTLAVTVADGKRIRFDRVTWRGNAALGGEFHAIKLNPSQTGVLEWVSFVECKFETCSFGLVSDSGRTGTIRNVSVDGCEFSGCVGTDLEFNWPDGVMEHVTVSGCRFKDNKSTGSSAAWGIGMANVRHAVIRDCTFDGYPLVPLHLEDRTADVDITGCRITNCATNSASGYASHLFLVNGTNDIRVHADNVFDMSANQGQTWAIYGGPGGNPAIYPDTTNVFVDPKVTVHYGSSATELVGNFNASLPLLVDGSAGWVAPVTVYSATFDASVDGWGDWGGATVTRSTTTKRTGAGALQIAFAAQANAKCAGPSIPTTAGSKYKLSAWLKGTAGQVYKLLALDEVTPSQGVGWEWTMTGDWVQATIDITIPASADHIFPQVVTAGATNGQASTVYVDDVQLVSA